MKKDLLTIFILLLLFPASYSQVFREEYNTRRSSLEPGDIKLRILGATFFNNNEFFSGNVEGYTMIGAFLQPELVYQVNPRFNISAGVHLREFSGDDDGLTALPLVSLNYQPSESFSIIMGSFEGGYNHKLPEAIFSTERHFSDLVEKGILIDLNRKFLESRFWLNWEEFIEPGDTIQEEFTAGITNRFKVTIPGKLSLEVPVYILAHHMGGQINNSSSPVRTYFNLAQGITLSEPLTGNPGVYPYGEMLIHEFIDDGTFGGYAFQLTGGAKTNHIDINGGFFHGDNFSTIKGLRLYESPGISNIITFKAGLKAGITERSFLFLRFEGYYNTNLLRFDYTYGIDMQVILWPGQK